LNPGDTTQLRLAYASGPISFAVALEDGDQDYGNGDAVAFVSDSLGVAGKIKYSGDTFSGEIGGGYWGKGKDSGVGIATGGLPPIVNTDTLAPDVTSAWQVGAGLGFSFDPISLSLAAGVGQDHLGYDYWKASALASANLNDSVHAEVAYGYSDADGYIGRCMDAACTFAYTGDATAKTHAVLAGIYYDPVSQLTIGLEGEWYRTKVAGNDDNGALDLLAGDTYSAKSTNWQVDLVTVFRF
jgi:hypothetical protein